MGCIPKQPDSQTAPRDATGSGRDGAFTLSGAPFQGTWARSVAEDASPDYNSNIEDARFSSRALPGSLAVTRGILTDDVRVTRARGFFDHRTSRRPSPTTHIWANRKPFGTREANIHPLPSPFFSFEERVLEGATIRDIQKGVPSA
ncbi:hypothetical protein Ddye_023461 [Dipteronia dyeriana]|uniref:Uncharacterized protein n=1 Tax=Dipteronia dyeriana TaxID=168575 RepID=A0AAD9TTL2_9ROSI|nr:hypothetical protein Ddye_023461 [Dipteronia dyeriana]